MRDNFMKIVYGILFLLSLVVSLTIGFLNPVLANQSSASEISITHLSTFDGERSHQSQCQIINKDGVVVWLHHAPLTKISL